MLDSNRNRRFSRLLSLYITIIYCISKSIYYRGVYVYIYICICLYIVNWSIYLQWSYWNELCADLTICTTVLQFAVDLQTRHWCCCSIILLCSIPHHVGNTAWPLLRGEPGSILLPLLPSRYVRSPGSGRSKHKNWSKDIWRWIVLSIPSPDWFHPSGENTPLRDSFAVCGESPLGICFHIVYITDFRAHVNCYPLCPAQRHSEMFCQPCEGLFFFFSDLDWILAISIHIPYFLYSSLFPCL